MTRLTREQVLAPLARLRSDDVVVTTMGAVRPWAALSESPLDFASTDSAMGHAADFALGIALARPERRVICLNGDGSMLMTLGTLVTIADSGATNLVLFVLSNRTYEITGNQRVPGGGEVDFAAMARASGWPRAYAFDEPDSYEQKLPSILRGVGPVLVSVHIEAGSEGPLSRGTRKEPPYLHVSLAESARRLRAELAGE